MPPLCGADTLLSQWGSCDAYEDANLGSRAAPTGSQLNTPASLPQIADLIAAFDRGQSDIFAEICERLGATIYGLEAGLDLYSHGWQELAPDVQARVTEIALAYLRQPLVSNAGWVTWSSVPREILYGQRALRLLFTVAKQTLNSLGEQIWKTWMFSAIGSPYVALVPGDQQAEILRIAYARAPQEFVDAVNKLIDGESQFATTHVIKRTIPIWDERIAEFLRSKLKDLRVKALTCEQIFARLLEAGDEETRKYAERLVEQVRDAADEDLDQSVVAAIQLLRHEPEPAWDLVWRAVEANSSFANRLVESISDSQFDEKMGRVIDSCVDERLSDIFIRLHRTGPLLNSGCQLGIPTLTLFQRVIVNQLFIRGTSSAVRALRRIGEACPDELVKEVVKSSEELVRRNTWTPITPEELFSILGTKSEIAIERKEQAVSGGIKPRSSNRTLSQVEDPVFRLRGKFWEVGFAGKCIHAKDSVGMRYIQAILRLPRKLVSCSELAASVSTLATRSKQKHESNLFTGTNACRYESEMIDQRTVAELKSRLKELQDLITQADNNNDPGCAETLRVERGQIEDQLTKTRGLGHRHRAFSDAEERTRKRVCTAIQRAIESLRVDHTEIAEHLDQHIDLGMSILYKSDLDWQF